MYSQRNILQRIMPNILH